MGKKRKRSEAAGATGASHDGAGPTTAHQRQPAAAAPAAPAKASSPAKAPGGAQPLSKSQKKRAKKKRKLAAAAAPPSAAATGGGVSKGGGGGGGGGRLVSSPPSPSKAAAAGKTKKPKNKKQQGKQQQLPKQPPKQQPPSPAPKPQTSGGGGALSSLQAKMKARLDGARFRDINEMLYTSRGDHALSAFKREPELFDAYHKGFREQVAKWPRNPLDDMIAWVRKQPRDWAIADFGCGEARLAASVPHKVHSFDLVAPNPRVTACDIAHVPLPDKSVRAVVFCLSLMGTNMMDFMREACRVLVDGGVIKVAEVRSRFEGQEGGVEAFVAACKALGLWCKGVDKGNRMFFLADFVKAAAGGSPGKQQQQKQAKAKGREDAGAAAAVNFQAKACVYKRR